MKVQPEPAGAMKVQPEPAGAMKVPAVAGFGPVAKEKLEIRQVWAHNVDSVFREIRRVVEKNPYVAMDTEFPGVIHHSSKPYYALTPTERYASLKANVDALHLIQVGLAFAPSPDSPPAIVFEINLREFDPRVHRHAPESVKLLADHGLDFAAHRAHGVEARVFAAHLMSSGLVCSGGGSGGVTWATFHSAYDFGYLVKLLIGRKLPKTLPEFLGLVRVFFGEEVYDVKHMMKRCPWLGGGLDGVAAAVGVQREAGRAHQAGSDSALTWDAFRRIREVFFAKDVRGTAGVLYGLELEGNLIPAAVDEKSKCGAIISAAAAGTGNGKCGAGLVVGGAAATGKGNGGRRAGRKFGHNNNRAVAALR